MGHLPESRGARLHGKCLEGRERDGVRGRMAAAMAVLTGIAAEDARALMAQYGAAGFRGIEGIPGGSVNSNFALEV